MGRIAICLYHSSVSQRAPVVDHTEARARAIAWLGGRYLLAKPINARPAAAQLKAERLVAPACERKWAQHTRSSQTRVPQIAGTLPGYVPAGICDLAEFLRDRDGVRCPAHAARGEKPPVTMYPLQ